MSDPSSSTQVPSVTSFSPNSAAKVPVYVWPNAEHEAPENPYLYGNGTYDGLEVAPTNEKEQAAVVSRGSREDGIVNGDESRQKRRIWGLPVLAFWVLLGLLALAIILGAVLGGVLGSKAANKQPVAAPASTTQANATNAPAETASVASTSIAAPTPSASSEPKYSGPIRSDEWHYIFEPKNLSATGAAATHPNQALQATPHMFDTSKPDTNLNANASTTYDQNIAPLRNGTEPIKKEDGSLVTNHTQHWQFLEIPRTFERAERVRQGIGENVTLYWIHSRAYGPHFRLTTDMSNLQHAVDLPPFNASLAKPVGKTLRFPVSIGIAQDYNPAQWWYMGELLSGVDAPGDGFWIANCYTRTQLPTGFWDEFHLSHRMGFSDEGGPAVNFHAFMDAYRATQWVIDPIEKITDDGWSVVSSVGA